MALGELRFGDRDRAILLAIRDLYDDQGTYTRDQLLGLRVVDEELAVQLRIASREEFLHGAAVALVFLHRRGRFRIPVLRQLLREQPRQAILAARARVETLILTATSAAPEQRL